MSGLFAGSPLEQPVTCEHCGRPAEPSPGGTDGCACPRNAAGEVCPPGMQSPRVRREKRRGKWSTVISGVQAGPEAGPEGVPSGTPGDLKPLLKQLRTRLGTGGGLSDSKTTDAAEIVLQGDHREAVVAHLVSLGYKAKPAGG